MKQHDKKRKIKALVVIAELTVQKVGEIQVAASLGVKINHQTGELETPVELKLIGQPVFTATIVPCKLINHGLQKACLVVRNARNKDCNLSVSSKKELDIPIYGMHDIPNIEPGDHIQEAAKVESIDIRGIREPGYKGCGNKSILIIKVVYKIKVTIAREEIISIPKYCEQDEDDCCINELDDQYTIVNKNNIKVIVNPCKDSWPGFR